MPGGFAMAPNPNPKTGYPGMVRPPGGPGGAPPGMPPSLANMDGPPGGGPPGAPGGGPPPGGPPGMGGDSPPGPPPGAPAGEDGGGGAPPGNDIGEVIGNITGELAKAAEAKGDAQAAHHFTQAGHEFQMGFAALQGGHPANAMLGEAMHNRPQVQPPNQQPMSHITPAGQTKKPGPGFM